MRFRPFPCATVCFSVCCGLLFRVPGVLSRVLCCAGYAGMPPGLRSFCRDERAAAVRDCSGSAGSRCDRTGIFRIFGVRDAVAISVSFRIRALVLPPKHLPPMKILIVEDEPSLREIMVQTLRREQYVVEQAADYTSALDKIAGYDYDCILLDIMLPDGSGLRLLEELKQQRKRAGVIIISARDSLDDKVEGLELGADDYLPKPFHLAELSARIRSVVRRHQRDGQQSLDAGNVRLFPDSRRVEVAGQQIELLRKEYDILYYFMSRPNHMVDKTTLAEAVWGDHIDQADNFDFVYAQMKNLRRRLHDAQADIEIRAVYGFGYKLVTP